MKSHNIAMMAALGSLFLLLGAFGFQYLAELPPCKLCIWQRWPHGAAILLGVVIALWPQRGLYLLGAAIVLVGAGIAFYHVGVEQAWWEGPTTCTSQGVGGLDADQLMEQIMSAPLVRCDEIAWSLFGISMAGWNGLISLGLGGLWLAAFRKGAA